MILLDDELLKLSRVKFPYAVSDIEGLDLLAQEIYNNLQDGNVDIESAEYKQMTDTYHSAVQLRQYLNERYIEDHSAAEIINILNEVPDEKEAYIDCKF